MPTATEIALEKRIAILEKQLSTLMARVTATEAVAKSANATVQSQATSIANLKKELSTITFALNPTDFEVIDGVVKVKLPNIDGLLQPVIKMVTDNATAVTNLNRNVWVTIDGYGKRLAIAEGNAATKQDIEAVKSLIPKTATITLQP